MFGMGGNPKDSNVYREFTLELAFDSKGVERRNE